VIPEAVPVSRLTPDRLVLALGLAGGLLLVFVTPPFHVPDEPAHFFRAYQLATAAAAEPGPGALGYRLPASLWQVAELCTAGVAFHPLHRLPPGVLAAAWRLPLAPERRVFLPAGSLTPYTPVPYLATAAAVAPAACWRCGRSCSTTGVSPPTGPAAAPWRRPPPGQPPPAGCSVA
jgi:hypothetical protein